VLGKAEWANLDALKDIDLLMASPECTRHSTAAGKLKWTPEAEGSRATAWQVYRYAKALSPRWLVVENVRQIQLWSEYKKWVKSIQLLGYNIRTQLLNAADFGVPQSRVRWFLIGDKEGIPEAIRPTVKNHQPAYTIIDWSIACPSIFGRRKNLAPNTMRRILIGLERFCKKDMLEPFMVTLRTNATVQDLKQPIGTLTAGGVHHGLVIPYMIGLNHAGADGSRVRGVESSLWTVTTANGAALVVPFVVAYYSGGGQTSSVDQPLPTVVTKPRFGVVAPFILHQQVGGTPRSPGEPMPTIMTKSSHGVVAPMLGEWELPKLPARDPYGVIRFMKDNNIVDIGLRMLQPAELQRAMGFPDNYVVKGSKTEVVRQLGNAVAPPVMRAIIETLCVGNHG
jgi:DNA (cytosine-5)-methyltransferase 1